MRSGSYCRAFGSYMACWVDDFNNPITKILTLKDEYDNYNLQDKIKELDNAGLIQKNNSYILK